MLWGGKREIEKQMKKVFRRKHLNLSSPSIKMKVVYSKLLLKLVCVALMLALAAGPTEAKLTDYLPSFRMLNPLYWLGWSNGPATNATSLKPTINNRWDNGSGFSSRVEPLAQHQARPTSIGHSIISIRPVTLQPPAAPTSTSTLPPTTRHPTVPSLVETTTSTVAPNEGSTTGSSPMPDLYSATNGSILNLFTTQKPREKPMRSQMKYIIKKKNALTNSTQLGGAKPSFATIS